MNYFTKLLKIHTSGLVKVNKCLLHTQHNKSELFLIIVTCFIKKCFSCSSFVWYNSRISKQNEKLIVYSSYSSWKKKHSFKDFYVVKLYVVKKLKMLLLFKKIFRIKKFN